MSIDPLFTTVQRALAGQYSLEREIGRGGMGVVYLAREVELARLVALKVLPPELAADPGVRERFMREARTAAGLSHPHIVPIHRVADAGDFVYFSMMFVDGETLGERLRTRGPLSASAATRMLREVSQALAYAHGRGIVHRDIKPDNILLERESGRALVTDFGIAAAADVAPNTGEPVMGTVQYMSPEQAAGLPLDGRSDLYSLGVVAHVALSGQLPSRALARLGGGAPSFASSSLAIASPATPRHLVAAIDRALALDPSARFATAEAFAEAIDRPTVARQVLPEGIRTWLAARDPWRAPYMIWTGGWLTSIALDPNDPSYAVIALIMSSAPAVPATVFELRGVRRLLDAGYSLDDARRAAPAWEAERRAEMDAEEAERPRWVAPVARSAAWGTVGSFVIAASPLGNHLLPSLGEVGVFAIGAFIFTAASALPLLNAAGIPMFPRVMRPAHSLRERFWNSRVGRTLAMTLFRGPRALPAANAFRPTEIALGTAIGDLWRALPSSYRETLEDLPGVVQRLEQHATRAREVLVRVDESPSSTSSAADLAPTRERGRRDLEAAVSALESIRLDLLRLLGGDADLAPMTTVLDAAKRVGADLDRLSDAQREVERVVRPIGLDLRPSTPV